MMKKLSVIFILIAGALWGSSCLFVRQLTSLNFTPLQSTAIRVIFGALILNIMLIVKGKGFKLYRLSLRSYVLAAVSGLCSVFAMSAFYYECMTRTSAAVSAILLYTAPLFVMVMSLIFFKENLSIKKIVAFVVAIVGCALVSGIASGASFGAVGIIFGVLSGFSYSLYGILTTFFMKNNSETLSFSALSFAFAAIGAISLCDPADAIAKVTAYDKIPVLILFFVVFSLCTAVLPYIFYTEGLSGVTPSAASILAFSEPLTAALFGVFVLGQTMDIFGVIGIVLVTAAIVILNVGTRKKHINDKNDTESY